MHFSEYFYLLIQSLNQYALVLDGRFEPIYLVLRSFLFILQLPLLLTPPKEILYLILIRYCPLPQPERNGYTPAAHLQLEGEHSANNPKFTSIGPLHIFEHLLRIGIRDLHLLRQLVKLYPQSKYISVLADRVVRFEGELVILATDEQMMVFELFGHSVG